MKEQIKHAAKSFWSGFTSAIPDAVRYIRDHPRIVCLTVLAVLFIAVIPLIKGMAIFLAIIGIIFGIPLSIVYLIGCAGSNSWKPWT